jgi:hypothetical protein
MKDQRRMTTIATARAMTPARQPHRQQAVKYVTAGML